MESMISFGQKNTLAKYMILCGADNHPPMLDKDLAIRTKKYVELSAAEKIQVDYDMKATNIILQGDDPIDCLNKVMAFLTVVASSRQGLLNVTTVKEAGQTLDEEKLAFLADPWVPDGHAIQTIIQNNATFQTEDLDTYDSDCDDLSNAQAVLMANISNYGSDVILEVPHSETYFNDMENQSVIAMQDFEQPLDVNSTDNEIHSD
nr:hypothetical protein [Tanacetum cinerariifolium]